MKYLGSHARDKATYKSDRAPIETLGHWPQPEPEVPVTDAEVAAWRARHQATCSDKIARLLCALERDYTVGAALARSGEPTA